MKKQTILLSILLLSATFTLKSQQLKAKVDLWALSQEYLKAFEAIDFDKMGTFLHDSVTFFDISSRAVGKREVIQTWKNTFVPLPVKIKFEIGEHFVSGSFVVVNLRYEAMMPAQGKNTMVNIDVITVMQYRDGKIIFLHDYPDIDSYRTQMTYQIAGKYSEGEKNANLKVVEDFYNAYAKWDVATMASFYHDDVEFKDLTAKDVFKGGKFEHSGKNAVSNFWSGIFGDLQLEYVNMIVHNTFTAGDYVIANTTLSMVLPDAWTGNAPGKVYISIPIKTALKFKDGKIISQYDFADYATYNNQIKIQTQKGK